MQKRESPEFRSPEVGISAIDKAPLSHYNVKSIDNSIIPIEFPGRRHGVKPIAFKRDVLRLACSFCSSMPIAPPYSLSKGPVIIYRLEGGRGCWEGDHLIFRRTKQGGSVVTENPKGGITENFGRIQRGTTQICLENEDMVGGSRESSNAIRGDHFSEVTFKGGGVG